MPIREQHRHDLDTFYQLMNRLQQHQDLRLSKCNGEMFGHKKGVYFFFEPGEFRKDKENVLRVVRVGTLGLKQGSKRTLWDRLRDHRGSMKTGGGNHRGSVFRKLVGCSLIQKGQTFGVSIAKWVEKGASKETRALEVELEKRVSEYIREMPFVWVEINDPAGPYSRRGFIEWNSIALLSNCKGNPDVPSDNWLGKECYHNAIQKSGLWNSDHVDKEYVPAFLDDLKIYIEKQFGTLVTGEQ